MVVLIATRMAGRAAGRESGSGEGFVREDAFGARLEGWGGRLAC